MIIGIDVGGTNTDAVLLDGQQIVAATKTATTPDVTSGIMTAVGVLREASGASVDAVTAVMIGTTHFVNALVEAQRLSPTAVIRLGLPAGSGLPPLVGWPARMRQAIAGQAFMIHGGHEFDGRSISELRPDELTDAVDQALDAGAESIAISSIYSPVNAEFELLAENLIAERYPQIPVTLSHQIGRLGLLERENAAVINAALRGLARDISTALTVAVRNLGITAPLFVSQNDGTVMDLDFTRRYPVNTFASGPTNSMRGAAFLSGLSECVVIDVGGTTSDVGVLQSGYPREAALEVEVEGIRTNFRMPDVLSVGLGGGSRVVATDSAVAVGPDSVGYRIGHEALVFGGRTLTATDIAVAAGLADIGDRSLVADLPARVVDGGLERIRTILESTVDRMRTTAEPVDVVAVGGGSILVPATLSCASAVHLPENYAVANAIGAAIAQVGGEVDRIFGVPAGQRESVLDTAKQEAVDRAMAAGAAPSSIRIVDIDEVPLAYLPGNAVRIRVKAVGDLPMGRNSTAATDSGTPADRAVSDDAVTAGVQR
ncbi:MAG: hydantoinase/oxoprolinase family protein [Gordonia sp. (in: high G+C Gram-positive bacteria)]